MREAIGSPEYHGGVIDWRSGHLQTIRYAFGLAHAAVDARARIGL
jgi:gamma-glutamylputrescine oxidase